MISKRRQELFLDGMELAADMLLIAYARLQSSLAAFSAETRTGGKLKQATTAAILLDTWSVVDSAHRLRTLLQCTPLLKKKSPAVVSLLKSTEIVEGLRHFAQHMDKETLALAATGHPIWGSISWVYTTPEQAQRGEFSCLILIPGRLAVSKGHPIVNPLGREISLPVGMVCLTAGGMTVNLSDIHQAVARFRERLERAVGRAMKEREEAGTPEEPLRLELDT